MPRQAEPRRMNRLRHGRFALPQADKASSASRRARFTLNNGEMVKQPLDKAVAAQTGIIDELTAVSNTVDSAPASIDISVLIATRSRADSLRNTLDSMCAVIQDGITWELVIVDNGSEDGTLDLLREYESRLPLRWSQVLEPGQNRARNTVIPGLRGRITVLSDDDVVVQADWLQEWYQGTQRWSEDSIFAGCIVPGFPPATESWITHPDFPFRGQCFAAFEPRTGEGEFSGTPFGPNFALRTSVLKRDRFREDLGPTSGSYAMGGETELVSRLKTRGLRVIYLPKARLRHVLLHENLTMEKLLLRGYNAGRGDEYRRTMRKRLTVKQMRRRLRLNLPLKIAFYSLRCRVTAWGTSRATRFRYLYKLQSAVGRREQLQMMIAQ